MIKRQRPPEPYKGKGIKRKGRIRTEKKKVKKVNFRFYMSAKSHSFQKKEKSDVRIKLKS